MAGEREGLSVANRAGFDGNGGMTVDAVKIVLVMMMVAVLARSQRQDEAGSAKKQECFHRCAYWMISIQVSNTSFVMDVVICRRNCSQRRSLSHFRQPPLDNRRFHRSLGILLNHRTVESGDVLGTAAGDHAAVHHHFLIHPFAPGILNI